ncbi:MAG: class I SAM-dependent methyltransferase [Syntrophobacteraceae bacterium]
MNSDPKRDFFDGIAAKWDGWAKLDVLSAALSRGLEQFNVGPDETVIDLGCGTGNLAQALLMRLSERGRVIAVDFSPRMLDEARCKVRDPRVEWIDAAAESLPVGDALADRIICFSAWPHFSSPQDVALEMRRALKPGGLFHVWHTASRETINAIHAGAGEAIHQDLLAPAAELARLLEECGFDVLTAEEDDEHYLVVARKPGVKG